MNFSEIATTMKRSATIFLRFLIVLIGTGALAFMLWEPHIEGRNEHATLFEIYFKDPFLAYAYTASIPFFLALYQVFKVLGFAGKNQVFSQAAVKAMRTIKHCAMSIIGFVVISLVFMPFGNPDDDDGPQGVVMRAVIIFGSIVITAAATMFERILQSGVDIEAENDLTV